MFLLKKSVFVNENVSIVVNKGYSLKKMDISKMGNGYITCHMFIKNLYIYIFLLVIAFVLVV